MILKEYADKFLLGRTLGQQIRYVRKQRGLLQSDVAKFLQVHIDCLTNWENNKLQPSIKLYPRILAFLGYYPFKEDGLPSTVVRKFRYLSGLGKKNLADYLKVNPRTIDNWENGKIIPPKAIIDSMLTFISREN